MNTLQPLTAISEPPTQIQQELKELRGITSELEQTTQELWTRLATVVLPPTQTNKNPTPPRDGVPLANELREVVGRLSEIAASVRALTNAIQL